MRKIAASRYSSRYSVSEVFHIVGEKGIVYRDMANGELYQQFFSATHFIETIFGEPDYEKVHQIKYDVVTVEYITYKQILR